MMKKPTQRKDRRKPSKDYLEVRLLEARPNPMFPDWMTDRLRFLRYTGPVKCAHCGKMSRHHWTMLMAFRVVDPEGFMLVEGKNVLSPLTPVCRKHIMQPAI